jgi:hypothetical protein
MVFERGRLTDANGWQVSFYGPGANCAFPPPHLPAGAFGHHNIDALRYIFPDIWGSAEVRPVLLTLFPTRLSFVFAWH